ncbi:MAG: DMT family transporter [Bacteroidota bacterium]
MKKPLAPALTYTLIFLAMLFWGLTFVWSSLVFEYYSPVTTLTMRLLISTSLMFLGLWIFGMFEKIRKTDIKLFIFSALFNPFLYFLGENYGIKYSSATISAVVIAAIPVFTPILGYYYLKEKLSIINLLGMVVSFAGILLMLFNNDFSLNAQPLGVIALSVALVTAIAYSILLKKLSGRYSAFFIIAVQNLIGLLFFLPLFFIFDWQEFITIPVTTDLALSLLQLAVFGSSLAFVFYTVGTREIGVNKTNFFTNLIPVITAIFSYFVLDEFFDLQKIVGMLLVIIGVILSQLHRRGNFVAVYRFLGRFRK